MFDVKYYKTPSEAQQLELISTGIENVFRERCMDWVICKVLTRELKELNKFKICCLDNINFEANWDQDYS